MYFFALTGADPKIHELFEQSLEVLCSGIWLFICMLIVLLQIIVFLGKHKLERTWKK